MSTPAVHRGTVSLRRAVTSWALGACLMSGAAGISLIATTGSTALATRVSQSPRGAANVSGAFNAVTLVPGSKDVIAVGSWYGVSSSGDVIEEWNGSSWKNMKVPSFGAGITSEALSGVWAASASDVWAVGYEVDASGQTAQLLHWNGKSWKADTLTGLPANSVLSAISGVSSSDIWSVGYGSGRVSTAIEVHYNGTSWAVSTQGPSNAILSGVAAVSASSVWAIGSAGATPKPLVLHYDGSSWKSSSSPAASDVYFNAVSASGSTAWVVGSVDTSKPAAYSMEWTGSKWVSIKMAVPSGQAPRPTAVLTLSSLDGLGGRRGEQQDQHELERLRGGVHQGQVVERDAAGCWERLLDRGPGGLFRRQHLGSWFVLHWKDLRVSGPPSLVSPHLQLEGRADGHSDGGDRSLLR